jgi:hypothetical protein
VDFQFCEFLDCISFLYSQSVGSPVKQKDRKVLVQRGQNSVVENFMKNNSHSLKEISTASQKALKSSSASVGAAFMFMTGECKRYLFFHIFLYFRILLVLIYLFL